MNTNDSTVTTDIPAADAASLQTDKTAQLNVPDIPDAVDTLFKQMKVDELILTDVGPTATIDVQPDFRYIIYQLCDHATRIYQQIEQLNNPSITPASLLASFLHSIYTYGALNDIYLIREVAN